MLHSLDVSYCPCRNGNFFCMQEVKDSVAPVHVQAHSRPHRALVKIGCHLANHFDSLLSHIGTHESETTECMIIAVTSARWDQARWHCFGDVPALTFREPRTLKCACPEGYTSNPWFCLRRRRLDGWKYMVLARNRSSSVLQPGRDNCSEEYMITIVIFVLL